MTRKYEASIPDTGDCRHLRDYRSVSIDTEIIPPEEVNYRLAIEQAHDPDARKATDAIKDLIAADKRQRTGRCNICGERIGDVAHCPICNAPQALSGRTNAAMRKAIRGFCGKKK